MKRNGPNHQSNPAYLADSSTILQQGIGRNRDGERVGVYAVCSAHPSVIDGAVQQSIADESVLHVESTSSQVNQFGGYARKTPRQFADFIHSTAEQAGLPAQRVLLGADHLGPFPWRDQPSKQALEKACELARACVLAGYKKIHLDASMPCADDQAELAETVVAQRAALLCEAAERAFQELPPGSLPLLYVIGTEVPAPGGASGPGEGPVVTTVESIRRTLEHFRTSFAGRHLSSAWDRVIGLVVQPGVEFGEDEVIDYERSKAHLLVTALPQHPPIVYEAHSTDYQSSSALAQMVEDHFAILKVGPWLTFAFREAVFALTAIERETVNGKAVRLSQVREALDAAMLRNPSYWRSYYHGDEDHLRRARAYGYSDRCRYYWHEPGVQEELSRLVANVTAFSPPPGLISQYLPAEYAAIRAGELELNAAKMIQHHIRTVLRIYAAACHPNP
jgi:D-tagatose-1,6-bisphosphate aldolase subunit GatZ/KbaZ